MEKLKVMSVFGTRPDAVKMAPLVRELSKYEQIASKVCVTAQHRQMLDQVLDIFGIKPDYDLDIMQERQSLEHITTRILVELSKVLDLERPDIVLVHGDTTTCFAAALAAFYKRLAVGHVEAGLRTFDRYSPYPEEMNRKLAASLSDLHFCPTSSNRQNLLKEGVPAAKIYTTGNTALDALKTTVKEDYVFQDGELRKIPLEGYRLITVTAHRRENLGEPLENICHAIKDVVLSNKEVRVIYAVHLNPAVQETARRILGGTERVHLIKPLDVQDMHNLMSRSYLILTDSGGIQEEAPALGRPVLVLRNETERPEAVAAGTVKLAGTSKEAIVSLTRELLDNKDVYERMAKAVNPYGDGRASRRIAEALLYETGISSSKPEEFQF